MDYLTENVFMKDFPRTMQDRNFVSWHVLGCTWGLRLPIKKVHISMIFCKNMAIFVKSSLEENFVANFYQATR